MPRGCGEGWVVVLVDVDIRVDAERKAEDRLGYVVLAENMINDFP